jgi:hypothetical protein
VVHHLVAEAGIRQFLDIGTPGTARDLANYGELARKP